MKLVIHILIVQKTELGPISCGYKAEKKAEPTHLDQEGWLGTYFQIKRY